MKSWQKERWPLTNNGDLIWNTFLGGSWYDAVIGISADNVGNIYVGGHSTGTWGSPVWPYVSDRDASLAKLNSSNGNLTWNTFMGGNQGDYLRSIAVGGAGNVYVAGTSGGTWGSPVRPYTSS